MLSSKRLQPIHELARTREDDAARNLSESRRLLTLRESQLRELESYREPPVVALSAEMLRNREVFRMKLSEAIRQQRGVIEQVRGQVEAHRQQWFDAHRQTQIYEKLIERSRQHEVMRQAMRDQREQDELALRRLRNPVSP